MPGKARHVDFWPDEWIGGTTGMSLEQEGLYIRLCSLIYSSGRPLPRDRILLSRLCRIDQRRLDRVIETLLNAGKCLEVGETLTVLRCEVELKSAVLRAEVGRKNVAKRWKNNETLDTKAVVGSNANYQLSTTSASSLEEEPEGKPSPRVIPMSADPVKAIFDRGLAILGQNNRAILGKARKQYGDVAVLAAIQACENTHPSEPAGFFFKSLESRQKRDNGYAGFGAPGFG